jgi:hypothetical protein
MSIPPVVIVARSCGFAAGCEAGLRPAALISNLVGLRPWFGLGPIRADYFVASK